MARILVTGGTGALGRELVPRLIDAGYAVRILSRSASADDRPQIEWVQADLATGQGLEQAVSDIDGIVHAASSPLRRAYHVDELGTQRLLEHARAAGVSHFVYISIVGVDRIPLRYYRHKLAAESLVEHSRLPWSMIRATQFHTLIDMLMNAMLRLPVALVPTDLQFQPIDAGEVADFLCECVARGPSGRLPDLGGPEVHTLGDLARVWLDARGRRCRVLHLPLPGRVAQSFRHGWNTVPQHPQGRVTWAEWVYRQYAAELPNETTVVRE